MTELAYLADMDAAYVRSFRARVEARPPGAVVLDRTFFYATGGGQPCDRGTLVAASGRSVQVVDVTKSGASVIHRVRGNSEALAELAAGTEVDGAIDFDRRHRHMRLHTAQHFLSASAFARTGLRTRKAKLADIDAALDLEGSLPMEALPELVREAADLVTRPREVRIRHVARSEWEAHPSARSGLVPLAPQVDPVRVIEIEGIDTCPCGGTHVRSTGEIGPIEIRPPTPIEDGGTRLSFTLTERSRAIPGA